MARRAIEDGVGIEISLDEIDDPQAIRRATAKAVGVSVEQLPEVEVRRRSIDARRKSVRFQLQVGLAPDSPRILALPKPREVSGARRVLIVGDGPAGLFCAYQLARHGIRCVVLDRGRQVQPRRRDLKLLNQRGHVDESSNYCFGEGGAGTYSDGKLYTRAHKRGNVRDAIEILVDNGAPESILVDARPHIGSNKLPKVVTAMRERLQQVGVEFRFETTVIDLDITADRSLRGVVTTNETVPGDALVLATGHSARDVFRLLTKNAITLEPKPFALGVRIEHPQPLINAIQYGPSAGHPKLPAASYRLAQEIAGRGVFSFCMCPGGWIVPAATEPDGLVVNGMSLSRRDSPFANSGLVVAIELEDLERAGFRGPLAGIDFQRAIEKSGFDAGGGALCAPATRVVDFLGKRGSTTVPKSSYIPGTLAGDISAVLDSAGLEIAARMRQALQVFGKRLGGYLSDEASLIGVESRTSAPVRVPRRPDDLQSPDLAGLYPCGEGAGYAGGIISAALDGMRVANAIIESWASES